MAVPVLSVQVGNAGDNDLLRVLMKVHRAWNWRCLLTVLRTQPKAIKRV